MIELRYPRRAIVLDLMRSGAGAAVTGLPALLVQPPFWLAALLAALAALFLVHLTSTLQRARRRYALGPLGLRVLPAGATIVWAEMDALDLDYFSTRRDGRDGWMQLRLRAGPHRVRVDSSLSGFDSLLARAERAAGERGLALSPTTRANLSFVSDQMGAHHV